MLAESEGRIRDRNMRKILKVATEIFSREGYHGARMAEIAKASGLPKANVYYYFSSKEEIYRIIITALIKSWDEALEAIAPEHDPRDAFRDYIAAKLAYSRDHPAESRLFANEVLRGATFLTAGERDHIRAVTDRHATVIRDWMDQGRLNPVDPYHLLIMLWAATEFYADHESVVTMVLRKKKLKQTDFELAAETIADTVLSCLLPASSRR